MFTCRARGRAIVFTDFLRGFLKAFERRAAFGARLLGTVTDDFACPLPWPAGLCVLVDGTRVCVGAGEYQSGFFRALPDLRGS